MADVFQESVPADILELAEGRDAPGYVWPVPEWEPIPDRLANLVETLAQVFPRPDATKPRPAEASRGRIA